MSTSRPKVKLDEQSFQDMLAAAYTIQEHNAKRRRALQPQPVCQRCGAAATEGEALCRKCAGQELRPGEQMQRKWASLWMMSQEQGLVPPMREDPVVDERGPEVLSLHFPEFAQPSEPEMENSHQASALDSTVQDDAAEAERDQHQVALTITEEPALIVPESELEVSADEVASLEPLPSTWNLRDLQLTLRFHRADLYLVVAIIVATFAMVWVLVATPGVGAQRKPRLRPWERALISLGLADAPEAPPQRGNPNAQVWVDPRTALYYCTGEEQYGKTPGGRSETQRAAQLDQFEPAGRTPCE